MAGAGLSRSMPSRLGRNFDGFFLAKYTALIRRSLPPLKSPSSRFFPIEISDQFSTMASKRSILITGCSEGGLGAALAQAFHDTGRWRVLASARNPKTMEHLAAGGIETLVLDVLSEESIKAAVEQVSTLTKGKLDALLLNAGGGLAVSYCCQYACAMNETLQYGAPSR
jgi:threonine dehydrogenase-like Zn-dependent dehydrogenase